MSSLEYFQWYYLIYLVPGGTALLTLMLSMMGGGMRHHRGGHSGGHHHHGGIRHGGHIKASHGGRAGSHRGGVRHQAARGNVKVKDGNGSDQAAALAHQAHAAAELTFGEHVTGFIGFGRIPSPLVWGSLLLGWGVFGLWATRVLEPSMRLPALFVLPAMGVAVCGSIMMARLSSAVLGRLMPHDESFDMSTVELVGLTGTVVFPIDQTRGRVHIYDDHSTLHDCRARVVPGGLDVRKGAKVLVIDYDPEHDQLIVEETN